MIEGRVKLHRRQRQTEAAKLLGVSRRTIISKIEAFGIDRPRKGPARKVAKLVAVLRLR